MIQAEKVWVEEDFICLEMSDKKQVRFPVQMNKTLREAPPEKVKNVELIAGGTGLHWPDLDEDLSVKGIIEGRFGRRE